MLAHGVSPLRLTACVSGKSKGAASGVATTLIISQIIATATASCRLLCGFMPFIVNHLLRGVVIAYG